MINPSTGAAGGPAVTPALVASYAKYSPPFSHKDRREPRRRRKQSRAAAAAQPPAAADPPRKFPVRCCNIMDPLCPRRNLSMGVTTLALGELRTALRAGRIKLAQGLAAVAASVARGDGRTGQYDTLVLQEVFKNSWSRFGRGDGYRPDLLGHPREQWEVSRAGRRDGRDPFGADREAMAAGLRLAAFAMGSEVTDSALNSLITRILTEKGPLQVGEVGKQLQILTGNTNLSRVLKEQFGGLKKFLTESSVVSIGEDHPFNPTVSLRPQQ